MNTFSQVWVFSDTPSRLPELMNGAQALANQINTFVLNDADGVQAIQLGANHVWKLNGKPDDRMIEDYAGVMADTIRQHGADGSGAAAKHPSRQITGGKTGLSP